MITRLVLLSLVLVGGWVGIASAGTIVVGQPAAVVAGYAIDDNFSSDTSANYTNIIGTISVSGGAAHGVAWDTTIAYHETTTGSNDHWASGTCVISAGNAYDDACVILGSNGTSYYIAEFQGGTFQIKDSTQNFYATYAGSYTAGTHTVAVQIDTDGSSHARFNAWVDGVQRITNVSDTANSITRGAYVGVQIKRGNANNDIVFDNLRANSGTYTP